MTPSRRIVARFGFTSTAVGAQNECRGAEEEADEEVVAVEALRVYTLWREMTRER